MNQAIFATVLAVTLGIASSFPLKTCDKLKNVKEGVDNYDQYLVKLKDSDNHMDAEYVINLVNQYQTILEQHASNVQEPSVIRSQLVLTENAGVLHGTLSQQALFLVCSESRVEFLLPDYPKSIIDPQDTEDVYVGDCFKLVLKEPYHGNNYSIIFKRKASLDTLYHVIAKMELAKLGDSTLTFNYYYSIKKGKQIVMVVGMNIKALHMVCKEKKVKQIKPNHDAYTINKRNTEATSDQDLMMPTTSTGWCGLPEHDKEFATFIFVYNETAKLDKIIRSVKRKRTAKVLLAKPIKQVHMIIFQMNKAAYLQACRNPKILTIEYAHPVTLTPSETATSTPKMKSLPTEATHTNICQHIDSLQDKINMYTVLLNKPKPVKDRRRRCTKLIKKLKSQSSNTFYAVTYPKKSCQTNGNDVKLMAKLNLKALKYVCTLKGVQVSVRQS